MSTKRLTTVISTNHETIGRVWLNAKGGLSISGDRERMRNLLNSMRGNRTGAGMDNETFLRSLPQRLNNGYVHAQPDSDTD